MIITILILIFAGLNVCNAAFLKVDTKVSIYGSGIVNSFETPKDYIISIWNPSNPSVVCNGTVALKFAGRQRCFTENGYTELKAELLAEFNRPKTEDEKMENGSYGDFDVNYLIPFSTVLNKELSEYGIHTIDFSKLDKPVFRVVLRNFYINLLK